ENSYDATHRGSGAPPKSIVPSIVPTTARSKSSEGCEPPRRMPSCRFMRILIATTQVPFVRGGAEVLAESLRDALLAAGHQAEIAAIPFKWYPPERILDAMLACRLLDLTESSGAAIDALIGIKFPAYLIPHPAKSLWL